MSLRRVIRRLLCRGNDPVSPVDQSLATRVSSDAEAVPLVGLHQNPVATQLMDSSRSTPFPPSLNGEHSDAPTERQQDHPQTRVSKSPEATPLSPNTSSHFHGQIGEANVNHVQGDYFDYRITHTHLSPDPASNPVFDVENRRLLDELGKKSALGAVANAEERAYAPRCLHETRTKVLNDLGEWSAAEGQWKDAKFLVLTGPAGHGKTAIMQSFAEQVSEESRATDIVVATFFFKATIPDQNKPNALVTTLAHQVAQHCESFRRRIIAVTRDNVAIFSMTLENQMKHLLVNPITELQASSPTSSFTVICAVDGLDECAGDDAQSRVIRLLHTLSTAPNTRVVLASRPEFPIQSIIRHELSGMLHIDLNKNYNAGGDIRQFTWVKLLDIRERLLPNVDRASWPHERDAEQIADYSSGQFILAETAMKYVDDRRYDPRKRLEEVLALCGGANDPCATTPEAAGRRSTQPLGTLDALFTGILERAARNAYPDLEPDEGVLELTSLVWTLIRLVPSKVEAATISDEIKGSLPSWVIEEALGRQSGDLARELSDLHSLLDVPQCTHEYNQIRAHHKSFLDFLEDPKRSGRLGNVPQMAEEQFDRTIKAHLSSLTVNDLKNLVSAQPLKPHILHHLYLLSEPETVIESINPKVWRALLSSSNAWETLLLKEWVHVGLSEGPLIWDYGNSMSLQKMDEASERSLHDLLFPGVKNERPADPPPISDVNTKFLLATLGGQGDMMSRSESFAFIPKQRTSFEFGTTLSFFPWFPAARALAWLWAPDHRHPTDHSGVTQLPDLPNLHPQKASHIVFIIGSAGSGKRELLEQAYNLLPSSKQFGPLEGWMPPVDILIVPDTDGLSLRVLWTPGSFAVFSGQEVPCRNADLTGKMDLGHTIPTTFFQDCITCWKAKHKKNTYHPQFLLQGLHLLLPEHQAMLLDAISSDSGHSDPTGRPRLFITVAGLPTATLERKLRQFSWPGVFYVNLDGMKEDLSLLEETLRLHHSVINLFEPPPSPSKIHKLARILATSPKPACHLKKLIDNQKREPSRWEKRLKPVLAVPEPEAWRLIEEHFGDIPLDDDSDESDSEEDGESRL